jgi:hypothetical protein
MNQYTIVYALARDLRIGGAPLHECYHHIARVKAPSLERAITRCRADAIRGFDFQLLVAVAGEPELLAAGDACLVHSFADGDDP